ncbi:MAG: DNA polymerase I [Chlorobi bacterium]|nr:DNA polymerase I [Chlorobiota bacterium]
MSEPRKRLFLLDAYALIYRGYYAFIRNPRINSKGQNTSAIYGFLNTLLDIIRKEKPDLLAVVFDKGGSEIREQLFKEYKANRLEQPEAIELAIPYIKRILEAMHIPVVEKEGWEADDLIGTLSRQAAEKGYEVYIVTSDKDFGQLVTDRIKIYRPATGGGYEIWDEDKVKEKFGVTHPRQVIDFLAMTGDSVDNVPGIPGVGEKTAKKFIAAYGSLEGLYENLDSLKGKMKEKVAAARDSAFMSKDLVTIRTDAPVEFREEDFRLSPPDTDKVLEIFGELEFRRLGEQFREIFGAAPASVEPGSPYTLFDTRPSESRRPPTAEEEGLVQTVDTPKARAKLAEKMLKNGRASVAWYPERFDFDRPLEGFAVVLGTDLAYYVPVPQGEDRAVLHDFEDVWHHPEMEIRGHDLKEWIKYLRHSGIRPRNRFADLMLMHYLIDPGMRHDLPLLAESRLGMTLPPAPKKGEPADLDKWLAARARAVGRLTPLLLPELKERHGEPLFREIEMPLADVLAQMELTGIKLDTAALEKLSREIDEEIRRLEEKIYRSAGERFNIGSPKQLGIILFEKLKIDSKPKKTKTGQYSTSEEVLSKYKFKHEIVRDILEWRQLQKLKSTYVDALPKQIHPATGKIHTHFNQAVTATGRLSSTDPNLQNIPIRTPRGRQIRAAFIPSREDFLIVSADYSQIELRLIAHLSGDENMLESFRRGEDIHRATAAKLFGVPPEEVTREQRAQAKTVNFGIIYGVSAHGLSQQTGLSRTEAKKLIEAYFRTYPRLKEYLQEQIEKAREKGYVETIMGRRRYLPDIHSRNAVVRAAAERIAVNAPVQGSAADIIKKAMVDVDRRLKDEKIPAPMLLQVHDELVFEVPQSIVEKAMEIIRHEMENAVRLSIPLIVDIKAGKNWLEAH